MDMIPSLKPLEACGNIVLRSAAEEGQNRFKESPDFRKERRERADVETKAKLKSRKIKSSRPDGVEHTLQDWQKSQSKYSPALRGR